MSPRGTRDYNRLKYYSALKTGYEHLNKEEFLNVPKHVLEERYFISDFTMSGKDLCKANTLQVVEASTAPQSQSSQSGTPWSGLDSSLFHGLIATLVLFLARVIHIQSLTICLLGITLFCFLISFYTCYLVLQTAGNDVDYTETLQKQFGRKGWIGGMILFIFNLFIPIILYFQLLAQNIYPILLAMGGSDRPIDVSVDFKQFSYSYTCVIIMVLLMAITAIRNLGIFVKINTFGVIFILMIIFFIIGVGIYAFTNTDFVFTQPELPDDSSYISLVNSNFGPLMGILGGGYYLHNITLPIIRNSKNPEKNARDVFIGYFMVFCSYTICGILGYFGFSGTYFTEDPTNQDIKSNCLLMFKSTNIFAIVIRCCVFCQLLAAMCLIFAV